MDFDTPYKPGDIYPIRSPYLQETFWQKVWRIIRLRERPIRPGYIATLVAESIRDNPKILKSMELNNALLKRMRQKAGL